MTTWRFAPIQKARRVKRGPISKPTQARRETFLRQAESAVKVSFLDGITRFRQRIPKAELDQAYRDKDYSALRKVIPWHTLDEHLGGVADVLSQVAGTSAARAIPTLSSREVDQSNVQSLTRQNVVDQTADRKTKYMRDIARNIGEEALDNVHQTIADGYKAGSSPAAVAANLRGSIGLTKPQSDALTAYQQGLEADPNNTTAQIAQLVKARSEQMLNYRAETIAITETRVAAAAAEQGVWMQQQKEGAIPATAQREWLAEPDACEKICLPMNGKIVGLDEPWVLPDGREVLLNSLSHPRCRCVETIVED